MADGWLAHHWSADGIDGREIGMPNFMISNLRPDLDVRPCETPFKAAAEPEPDVRPEEPRISNSGKPVPWSVTGICSFDMDPKVKAKIDETRTFGLLVVTSSMPVLKLI